VDEFHIDALRVDAVHAIVDHSAEPFLQDLTDSVRQRAEQLGRKVYTIAESDLNDPRVLMPKSEFGLGFDSQWADDYHHSLHTLLTREQDGYYQGFPPRVSNLARIMETGFLYTGQHSAYRGRKYGARPTTRDGAKFVVSIQNHDQVGNRMQGERLTALVPPEKARLAAAAVILSPFIPMLFMGEEYGEKNPFQYFTSHSDAALIEAVRKGRREEFEDFTWAGEPPDPHDEQTFLGSKLDWALLQREEHGSIRKLYKDLLALRRGAPSLRILNLDALSTHADDERQVLLLRRFTDVDQVLVAFNFSDEEQTVEIPFDRAHWRPMIESGAKVEEGRVTIPASGFGVFGG
jgi:maltooligosyltrehalose trehalohydrolase